MDRKAHRLVSAPVEQLESRRLMALTHGLSGIQFSDDPADVIAAMGSTKLNAKAIRIWKSTDFGSGSGDQLTTSEINKLKAYDDANIKVTLLVTMRDNPNDTPTYGEFKTWFENTLSASAVESYVDRWEIINEPDYDGYWENGDVTAYVNTALKAAWDVLHPAGETIVGAGMTDGYSTTDLNNLYNAGYQNYVDYLNIHPYSQSADSNINKVNKFKAKFASSGKPIVSTEWGFHGAHSTDNPNVIQDWEEEWVEELQKLHGYALTTFDTIYYYRLIYQDASGVSGRPGGLMYDTSPNFTPHQPFYDAYREWTTNSPPPPPPPTDKNPIEDTYVQGDDTTANGSDTTLQVKNSNSDSFDRETLLRFDISDYGTSITSAKLRLYGALNTADSVSVQVFDTASSPAWSDGTTVWSNRPGSTGSSLGTITLNSTTAGWKELDITGLIAAKRAAGATTVSILLRASQTATTTAFAGFNSVDAASERPELVVTETTPPTGVTSEDTYVQGNDATPNGSDVTIQVKNSNSSDLDREGLIRFDLTGYSTAITAAKLRLFGGLNTADSVVVDVFETAASPTWSEASTVWSNRPGANGTALGSITVTSTTAGWKELDVTNLVKTRKLAGATSISFLLRASQSATTTAFAGFNSKNASSNQPELRITQTLNPSEDTYVKGDDTTANGTETTIDVKNSTTDANDREGLVRFNVSTLGTINNAKLRLYGWLNTADTVAVQVFDTASSPTWSESSTVWTNRPGSTGSSLGTLTVDSTTAAWKELDITTFLQTAKANGATSVSFVLRASQAATTNAFVSFSSSNGSSNKPELVVT